VIAWLLVAGNGMSAFSCAGLALILGGATGNVTDRILHGAVTDFLEFTIRFIPLRIFNPWPAFNVADSAITIGALCILLDILFGHRSAKANLAPAKE
jgi:signal peptidase II